MDTPIIDLHAPTRQVAATLALTQLEHSLAAVSRLGSDDPESLHDVRVSIKRLRTLLKTYRHELGKSVNAPRKALGHLMDASNPGRDAEVQREWLLAQDADRLTMSARAGRELMLEHFNNQLNNDIVCDLRYQQRRLREIAATLEPTLRKKQTKKSKKKRKKRPHTSTFAGATRKYLQETYAQLHIDLQVLEQADAVQQQEALHRARLSGKRLRYLIEPLEALDASHTLLIQLKTLQDALGHMHDVYVLQQTIHKQLEQTTATWAKSLLETDSDPRPALCYDLAALARYVAAQLHSAVQDLQKVWHDEKTLFEVGFVRLEHDLATVTLVDT